MPSFPPTFNTRKLAQATDILHALAHTIRLQLVEYMTEVGQATVPEMQEELSLDAGVIATHLRVLRQVGILVTSRNGKFINYQIDPTRLSEIRNAVVHFCESVEEVEV